MQKFIICCAFLASLSVGTPNFYNYRLNDSFSFNSTEAKVIDIASPVHTDTVSVHNDTVPVHNLNSTITDTNDEIELENDLKGLGINGLDESEFKDGTDLDYDKCQKYYTFLGEKRAEFSKLLDDPGYFLIVIEELSKHFDSCIEISKSKGQNHLDVQQVILDAFNSAAFDN